MQNKRSGEEVLCLHIVLPRLLRPLRPVGYHQFLIMLLPHDQFNMLCYFVNELDIFVSAGVLDNKNALGFSHVQNQVFWKYVNAMST